MSTFVSLRDMHPLTLLVPGAGLVAACKVTTVRRVRFRANTRVVDASDLVFRNEI